MLKITNNAPLVVYGNGEVYISDKMCKEEAIELISVLRNKFNIEPTTETSTTTDILTNALVVKRETTSLISNSARKGLKRIEACIKESKFIGEYSGNISLLGGVNSLVAIEIEKELDACGYKHYWINVDGYKVPRDDYCYKLHISWE